MLEVRALVARNLNMTAQWIVRRRRVEIDGPEQRIAKDDRCDDCALRKERHERTKSIAHVTPCDNRRMRTGQVIRRPAQPLKAQSMSETGAVALDRRADDATQRVGDNYVAACAREHDGVDELLLFRPARRGCVHETAVFVHVPRHDPAQAERRAGGVATSARRPLRHVGDDAGRRCVPA